MTQRTKKYIKRQKLIKKLGSKGIGYRKWKLPHGLQQSTWKDSTYNSSIAMILPTR